MHPVWWNLCAIPGWIAFGQLFDSHVLGLVIGQAQVAVGSLLAMLPLGTSIARTKLDRARGFCLLRINQRDWQRQTHNSSTVDGGSPVFI